MSRFRKLCATFPHDYGTDGGETQTCHSLRVARPSDLQQAQVVDLLGSLVEKSLVLYDNGRFSLLESVRRYGHDRLQEADERALAAQRHAEYYDALLAGAEDGLSGPDQAEWMRLIDREHDNVRAALEYLLARPNDPTSLRLARSICISVWKYWSRKGLSLEGLTLLERAMGDDEADPGRLAAVCSAAGVLATFRGDTDRAKSCLIRALELRRSLGDESAIGRTLNNLGMLLTNVGEFDAARGCYAEALDLFRPRGPSYAYGTMLLNLGNLERFTGNDTAAKVAYEESRDVFGRVGDPEGEALAIYNLGLLLADRGEHAEAIDLHNQALVLFQEVGNDRMRAWALSSLGAVMLQAGDRDGGEAVFRRAGKIRRSAAEVLADAYALGSWAEFLAHDGRWEDLATLLGCFESQREALALPLTPAQSRAMRKLALAAREHLGEAAYDDLFARGIAYAPIDLLPA